MQTILNRFWKYDCHNWFNTFEEKQMSDSLCRSTRELLNLSAPKYFPWWQPKSQFCGKKMFTNMYPFVLYMWVYQINLSDCRGPGGNVFMHSIKSESKPNQTWNSVLWKGKDPGAERYTFFLTWSLTPLLYSIFQRVQKW